MISLFESRTKLSGGEAASPEVGALRAMLAAERRVSSELAHRNRNLLGVVAALGRRTLSHARDLPAARAEFDALIGKLAAGECEGLALRPVAAETPNRRGSRADLRIAGGSARSGAPRDLRALSATVLGGFISGANDRIRLFGPKVSIVAPASRLLALVLFELATNSLKHGALRNPDGRLRLDWSILPEGLVIRWRETAGAGHAAVAQDAGGGTALVETFAADLGGRFTRITHRGGYAVEMALPLPHFVAPVDPEAPAVPAAPPRESTASSVSAPGVPRRVLVVEDSPLIADDLAEILRAEGVAEVVVALSAEEARTHLARGGSDAAPPDAGSGVFDLVLLDVGLGDDSAETLLPLVDAARVVLVSGRSAEDMPEAFRGLPHVPKPFDAADLAEALRRAGQARPGAGSGHSIR